MLSEGRPGIDSLFSLREGMSLPITLSVATSSNKHRNTTVGSVKGTVPASWTRWKADPRWRQKAPEEQIPYVPAVFKLHEKLHEKFADSVGIEISLRQPSMVRGKKGFERIVWAFTNVLNHSVTWLFRDTRAQPSQSSSTPHESPKINAHLTPAAPAPIATHHPFPAKSVPSVTHHANLLVPPMRSPPRAQDQISLTEGEDALELQEWLGMVALASPRLEASDAVDPYLSLYAVPQAEDARAGDVARVRWKGFLPAAWARDLLLECL